MSLSTADELRIGELVVRYADAVTRADAVQWAGTWAAESKWHLRTSTVTGRDAIVARWLELLPSSIIQLVTKGWAEETAGGARGSWNILEILRRPGADRDCLQVVTYTDRYVREGDPGCSGSSAWPCTTARRLKWNVHWPGADRTRCGTQAG